MNSITSTVDGGGNSALQREDDSKLTPRNSIYSVSKIFQRSAPPASFQRRRAKVIKGAGMRAASLIDVVNPMKNAS